MVFLQDILEDITLGVSVSEEEQTTACSLVKTQSVNTHSKLLQFKWPSGPSITPVRLHYFNPNNPDTCIKCTRQNGTLFHSMWDCPQVVGLWRERY